MYKIRLVTSFQKTIQSRFARTLHSWWPNPDIHPQYAYSANSFLKKSYGTQDRNISWFANAFVNVLSSWIYPQNSGYNRYKRRVFHRYASVHVPVVTKAWKNFCHKCHICKEACGSWYAFSERIMRYNLWHRIYRQNFWQSGLYSVIGRVWRAHFGLQNFFCILGIGKAFWACLRKFL